MQVRVNVRPPQQQLDELCEAVGWSGFGNDYPAALDGYAATASAWTESGRLVGWTAIVSDNVRHAFLVDVMVHPEFQSRGVGRQVVLRAIEEMQARGVTLIHVDCAPAKAGFYEKCGFKIGAGGWMDTSTNPTQ